MSTVIKCQEIVSYLQSIMSKRNIYAIVILVIALFSIWILFDSDKENELVTNQVKVTLRDVGHQLLLSSNDSTSLVLPVLQLDENKYQISFQKALELEPSNVVTVLNQKLEKVGLASNYLVEVVQCTSNEVAYSFEIKNTEESNIIPCKGRILPQKCYTIEIIFTDKKESYIKQLLFSLVVIVVFGLFQIRLHKRREVAVEKVVDENHTALGSFQFYPEQNKLIKEAVEISLSKKECELLAIFIENLNKIIKREELMKRVWEDNGVIVGRSLDTYISKLRKKLSDDATIKLVNIHGVGYKLEITK